MFDFLKNRVTEKDIRDWLSRNGYFGNSAKFGELELHAIQRPGWYQIYRFHAQVKRNDDQWTSLFGTARDDERFRLFEVEIFYTETDRDTKLSRIIAGLDRGTSPTMMRFPVNGCNVERTIRLNHHMRLIQRGASGIACLEPAHKTRLPGKPLPGNTEINNDTVREATPPGQ